MTSVARISNQSVPNHVSEDMIFLTIPSAIYHKEEIFIAGLPDNIVVVQEKMRGGRSKAEAQCLAHNGDQHNKQSPTE